MSAKRPSFVLFLKMITMIIGLTLIMEAVLRPKTSYVSIDARKHLLTVIIVALVLSIPTFVVSACGAFPGSVVWRRVDMLYHVLMGITLASGAVPVAITAFSHEDTFDSCRIYVERLGGATLGIVNSVLYGSISVVIYRH